MQGMESVCVRAYGEALEVIPYTLAENAGLQAIGIVTELRNRHAQVCQIKPLRDLAEGWHRNVSCGVCKLPGLCADANASVAVDHAACALTEY